MHLALWMDMSFLEFRVGMLWFKEMFWVVKLTQIRPMRDNVDYQLDWIEEHIGDSWLSVRVFPEMVTS
jgi:hypothetical protein